MSYHQSIRRDQRGQGRRWLRLLVFMGLLLAARDLLRAQDIDPTSNPNVQPYAGTPVGGYQLAWSDEFNGAVVNTNKWNYRTGVRLWSTQLPANNSVSNGLYYLNVKKETVGSTDYTAGGIISSKLFRYGYYETRMKVPPGRGWHTSFWMMKQTLTTNDTAQIELDALENDSVNLLKYGINNHRWLPTPVLHFGSKTVTTPSLAADFHVIGCEYTSSTVKYFFDGVLQQTVATTSFTPADVNIWLTSVAANLGGTTNVDDSQLPNFALYDYARFFLPSAIATVNIVNPTAGGVTLGDTNTALRVTAAASSSDTNFPVALAWSKLSGLGNVTFANPTNADTTATFSTNGSYVLQVQAAVPNSTNTATINVSIAAPVSVALRQGVNGYSHIATFIRGDSVNWNSGGRDQFIVGRWGSGMRPLFSFNLSPLDSSAVFQSATLDVWTDDTLGTGSVGEVELRKLNATPTEGTGNGSSASNGAGTGATWLSRTGGTNVSDLWTNAGGDFETNVLASIAGYDATVANVQKTFPSSDAFVAAAQAAFNAGQPLNLLMISPTTETGANSYISRISSDDNATVEQRPQLTLTFLGNLAPGISPGLAPPAMVGVAAALAGVVSNSTSRSWSKISGPGTVTFGNTAQPATTATFNAAGNYVLRLSGSNALAQTSRDLAVNVTTFSRPQISSAALAGGNFQMQVGGPTGWNYTVQASTNLTVWADLMVTNPLVLPFTWTDTSATNLPRRFYRVLLGP